MIGLLVGSASADETEKALQFARETLAFVERSAPRPKLAAELAALEKRYAISLQDSGNVLKVSGCQCVKLL